MSSVPSPTDSDAARRRRRLTTETKEALRALNNQLSLFNRQVSTHLEVKDVDLDCLELITRHGPLSPSALARRAGLHPATLTGILDRLQRDGWISRDREPNAADRRAVSVRALRERNGEVYRLYAGMNTAMDQICADYTDTELELLADFLNRVNRAGEHATDELASD